MLLATEIANRHGGDGGPHFFFLLFLLLIGLLVTGFLRRRRAYAYAGPGGQNRSPLGTLQDRFVRGEIDRQEYEHRRAVLEGDKEVPPPPRTPAPPSPPAWSAPEHGTSDEPDEPDELDEPDDGSHE